MRMRVYRNCFPLVAVLAAWMALVSACGGKSQSPTAPTAVEAGKAVQLPDDPDGPWAGPITEGVGGDASLKCSDLQWWNQQVTSSAPTTSGWVDTDLAVRSGTQVVLRYAARLD